MMSAVRAGGYESWFVSARHPAGRHLRRLRIRHQPAGSRYRATAATRGLADFGVLAAVQFQDVGVTAVLRLRDVGVLAVIQAHDTEAAPGEHLAQVPHPAHARQRDGYAGGENRAAE